MELVIWALAAYGILRVVLDVVGAFHLRRLRLKHLQEEEKARRKTKAMEKRYGRMSELLDKKRQLFSADRFDELEEEAIDIELLTILETALSEEGSSAFFLGWRDELVARYAGRLGKKPS